MIFNQLKTWLLMGVIGGALIFAGSMMGGQTGALIALTFALAMNFYTYFYSDKLALKAYGAVPLNKEKYSNIYKIVEELSASAQIPMPRLWLVEMNIANAFATGRNPQNASIAVTTGILNLLDEDELRGVLAHELSHITNRDILVGTIAATMVAAIAYLADMMRWRLWFRSNRESGALSTFATVAAIILVPFAAMILQLSISRTRELMADESGAKLSYSPLALASALEKIHQSAQSNPMGEDAGYAQRAMSSMFICNPFKKVASLFSNLFSTHPPMEERVKKLRNMKI